MGWLTGEDRSRYLAVAGGYLRGRPVEHTLLLTVLESLGAEAADAHADAGPTPRYGWWRSGAGAVAGAFLQVPPYPVLLSSMPGGAAGELAGLLAGAGGGPTEVNAAVPVGEAFAQAWRRGTGTDATVRARLRLYRLAVLQPPSSLPAGHPRVAGAGDRDLLIRWYQAFGEEIGEPPHDGARQVDDRLGHGGFTLWQAGGETVCLAGVSRPAAAVVRVGPVYTPPGFRGRGYAAALTATVSAAARDAGADDVVLFTDLANPTSNAIYQRLGYRPVEDRVVLSFGGRPFEGGPDQNVAETSFTPS